ncbi:BQ5605_C004g02945 [Microbotryum silenes-dioicae]|uniref:chitin deacetylase n=1 Tax=Microbotryum silenes-dioicae TaxID=796604 RepID=A0A2X0PBL1_9BASI|nr:BQ5605_C004g02945 [Microbotryum silenes-dioicae]
MFSHVTLLLVAASVVTASTPHPLWERQSRTYPEPLKVGPQPLQIWIETYNQAKAAGKIPSFAPATLSGGEPVYASGVDTGEKGVCSWTLAHCFNTNKTGAYDIEDGPTGHVGISFDDGPTPASPVLYEFLQSKNLAATHFFIGSNIVNNPDIFDQAVKSGGHIAVHTWAHKLMTTLTDMQVLGELGWTMQIIHDRAGVVPRFWRPPYGDIDNRVRAIAKEVFGLEHAVIWNHDTNDWCLSEGGGSSCASSDWTPSSDAELDQELNGFYNGPKSPGLIILEHEVTSRSVGAFMRTFPTLISKGWIPQSIPDLFSQPWYLNAAGPSDTPTRGFVVGSGDLPNVNNAAVNLTSSSSSSAVARSSSTPIVTQTRSSAGSSSAAGSSISGQGTATAAAQAAASSKTASGAAMLSSSIFLPVSLMIFVSLRLS